jgi:hypothetical protein
MSDTPGIPVEVPFGSVVVLQLGGVARLGGGTTTAEDVAALRVAAPSVLLAASFANAPSILAGRIVAELASCGIRIFMDGESTVAKVREGIRESGLQSTQISTWLRARLPLREGRDASLCHSLGRLLSSGGSVARREVRWLETSLRRVGAPTVHKWTMLSKMLPSIIKLQGDTTANVANSAIASGYSDRRSLDMSCVTLTGLTARQLGDLLGWEAVLELMIGRKWSGLTAF